jgi:hypothetical protein
MAFMEYASFWITIKTSWQVQRHFDGIMRHKRVLKNSVVKDKEVQNRKVSIQFQCIWKHIIVY